jgi:tRNA-2-methylthio-N6-dimethylallyladenosine synthase
MIQGAKRKTYYIESYGCQMNLYDSDLMASILGEAGYRPADGLEESEVIIVNTCSVREHAEKRALGRIRELGGLKNEFPQARLVVCGCMAQRLGEEILRLVPGVDLVVGTDSYRKLPELLSRSQELRGVEISTCTAEMYSQVTPHYKGGISAFVSVMRGCDNCCSYCIVPQLRGPARSRPMEEIIQEIFGLVDKGCRQVILLGQNVNLYDDGQGDFADLLRRVNEVQGLYRIRFVTSHPRDMDEAILLAMAESDKVCEHLHLPLQSGSDKILRAMRRGYTAAEYRSLVRRARDMMSGMSLSTDLIAGFPGEREEDFRETIRLMRELVFDDAFTFGYSPRPGTEAVRVPNQVAPEVRHHRLERLIVLQRDITNRLNQKLIGRTVEVLAEASSKRNTEELIGRTRTNKAVIFPGGPELIGTLVNVRVQKARGGTAWGEMISCMENAKAAT